MSRMSTHLLSHQVCKTDHLDVDPIAYCGISSLLHLLLYLILHLAVFKRVFLTLQRIEDD